MNKQEVLTVRPVICKKYQMKILGATEIAIEKSRVLKSTLLSIGDFPRLELCSLLIELTFLRYEI